MWCRSRLFVALLLLVGTADVARAGFLGTMSFDYTLNLNFVVPIGGGAGSPPGDDFLSPYLLYDSPAELVGSIAGPFGNGSLESGFYPIAYTIPNFPLPSTLSHPFGGFFAYYSYVDDFDVLQEGAFVGLEPTVTPTGTFDEFFASTGVTEVQFLTTLMTPGQQGVLDTLALFGSMIDSGVMPTWSYNVASSSWSIAMNVYAFSDPQLSGTVTGGLVTTADSTPVPEPSSLTSVLIGTAIGFASYARRRSRRTWVIH